MRKVIVRNIKWLAVLLVAVLAMSLSGFTADPNATVDETEIVRVEIFAQDALYAQRDTNLLNQVSNISFRRGEIARANVSNAFGAPDSPQGAPNDTFTSLAYFPAGITYFFAMVDNPQEHERLRIFRCPFREGRRPYLDGTESEDDADISLVEVTWSSWWHAESTQVYLMNPDFVDGEIPNIQNIRVNNGNVYYLIGTAYNLTAAQHDLSRGIMYISGSEDFQRFRRNGDITHTDIFFPEYIISAEGVRLENNTHHHVPNNQTHRPCDGYDLDAMVAWFVDIRDIQQSLSFTKYITFDYEAEYRELVHPPDNNTFRWYIYNDQDQRVGGPLFTTPGTDGRVELDAQLLASLTPGIHHVREVAPPNWRDRTMELTFGICDYGIWRWDDDGYIIYINEFIPAPVKLTGLSWNNGNGNGNGGGINAFTFGGVGFRNNRNFLTPENFEAALINPPPRVEPAIYTVVERIVTGDNGYRKVHVIRIALRDGTGWRLYEGTITVDNPGGNNNRQQIAVFPVNPFPN